MRYDCVDLDEGEAAEVIRTQQGLAAEVMPLSLIEPVSSGASEDAIEDPVSWGLDAIGCGETELDGSGCVVAVLDTGIDDKHPAFAAVRLEQRDFTGTGAPDLHGHGTHCAGTIFGGDVGGRRIGVARAIERALVGKVLDDAGRGSTRTLVEGLRWAAEGGAHVVSCSAGIEFDGFFQNLRKSLPDKFALARALLAYERTIRIFDAISQASSVGAFRNVPFHVFASGNSSERGSGSDLVAGSSAPGRCFGMSIGAVARGRDGYTVADFSNGPPDLVAPGVGILSAAPGGGLATMDGTSMACPHVAGIAALWAQRLLREDGEIRPDVIASKVLGEARREGFEDLGNRPRRLVGSGMARVPS